MSSRAIQAIDKRSIHRICSGQVVLDLATAVKELVENSLDAGATSIEVKLRDHGGELIEVSDNGTGISPDNFQGLALKYHTSKLWDFTDLQSITSFGFRGEALSSLCALADVSILTKTEGEGTGTRLCYDRSGLIVSRENAARQVGTTVYVGKLFHTLPVRHKEFTRNIRREYGRMVSILQAYALISKQVRLVCTNQTGKSTRSTVLRTQGSGSMKENIVNVFGGKTVSSLVPLDISLPDDMSIEGFISKPGSGSGRASGDRQFFFVNGRPVDMSKIGKMLNEVYKSFNSQQYPMAVLNFRLPTTAYDVNVTPDKRRLFLHAESCFMNGVRSALNNLYAPDKYLFSVQKEPSPSQKSFTADLMTQVDVEALEPIAEAGEDESQVEEDSPCVTPVDLLSFRHESVTASKPSEETPKAKKPVQAKLTGFVSQTKKRREDAELLTEEPVLKKRATDAGTACDTPTSLKRKSDICSEDAEQASPGFPVEREQLISEDPVLKNRPADAEASTSCKSFKRQKDCTTEISGERYESSLKRCTVADTSERPSIGANDSKQPKVVESVTLEMNIDLTEEGVKEQEALLANINDEKDFEARDDHDISKAEVSDSVALLASQEKIFHKHEKLASTDSSEHQDTQETREVRFDFETVRNRIRKGLIQYDRAGNGTSKRKGRFTAATVQESASGKEEKDVALASATRELERSFNKVDFNRMKIVGQFNLGFIIAKLDHDLFIIDQHASDEKFNFEKLSKSTVLNRQPLLRPLPLNLSSAEEITISTHMDVFRRNGFDFTEKPDAVPGERVSLCAVPFSKNVTFGASDVHELVSLVTDETFTSDSYAVRPTRVRAMLASRACRSSIMIGDALSRKEMEKVVRHLAELDAPWNCPHGRPTMRHLCDLSLKMRA